MKHLYIKLLNEHQRRNEQLCYFIYIQNKDCLSNKWRLNLLKTPQKIDMLDKTNAYISKNMFNYTNYQLCKNRLLSAFNTGSVNPNNSSTQPRNLLRLLPLSF